MTEPFYVIMIVALLPITAFMVVSQVNPYHALVIRGILGAVAALVYALLGAADVSLTEALVGTMLSITLYAVAVRSSLSMRLGVIEPTPESDLMKQKLEPILVSLRQLLRKHHMRLELVNYPTLQAMEVALESKEIHTTCIAHDPAMTLESAPYLLQTRVQRLYQLMETELPSSIATVSYNQPGAGSSYLGDPHA